MFRHHEALFSAQYRELKEQSLTAGRLLAGTPGTLHRRSGTGYTYCYRVFYPVPGLQAETLIGRADDKAAEAAMQRRMASAEWVSRQVATLRKVGFQVDDKRTARLMVELHNLGAFAAGLIVLGNLACRAWLNELGVTTRSRPQAGAPATPLAFGAGATFFSADAAAQLPLVESSDSSILGVSVAGLQGMQVQLVPRREFARTALDDYLLEAPVSGAVLAGGHSIPVLLPQAARLVWQTLLASLALAQPEEMNATRHLALAVAATLIEDDPWALLTAWENAPAELTTGLRPLRDTCLDAARAHPDLCDLLADCLR